VPGRARERHHHRSRGDPDRRPTRSRADHREVRLSAGASDITVVGSVAFDTIETPQGRAEGVLGGSATHFAVAASYFAPVHLVAVVGDDFPPGERDYLASRDIDLSGLEVRPGRTFRWTGRYHDDMNVRDTLALELNVFADFRPRLGDAARRARFVFLANIDPRLQQAVLDQFEAPAIVAADTMNHWIDGARDALVALLPRVDLLILNDEEARLLSGEANVSRAARRILALGPRSVLIKRGEYGAILFSSDSVFAVPAYPLEEVFDPTGAGDVFAGGVVGYLAATGERSEGGLRRAIVFGSVLASYVVEDFGGQRLRALTRDDIDRRYRQFVALTEF
jgi:sugar/nucleoside kinase (ribokinase family)